jgi:PAS domain S-box-containing protein
MVQRALDPRSLELFGSLTGVGYFQVDAERNVVAISPELEGITGFSAAEVIGKPCIGLIRCQECLKTCGVFRHERVQEARIRIYRKDGAEIEVWRSGAVLRDADHAVTGALETVRPLGDASCDATLVPRELDVLLRGLGRLFIAADEQMRIRAFSPSLATTLGWPEERLLASSLDDLFGDELFGALGALRTAVTAGKRREGWHASLPRADGTRLPVSISVAGLADDDRCGHPDVRVVVMIRPDDEEQSSPAAQSYHGIVGRSVGMQRIFHMIDLLRDNDATVLISGESGTGKELVARAIHATSNRSKAPFVAVNCAALPSELLESELFGHVRGSFTGAVRDRMGRFELAHGGTLFLDEIGDLAMPLQAKILRALQERAFERIGDTRTRTVDVRIIAATNTNLPQAVTEHRFREDLYYRLRVIPLEMPPLRERREDLPALIDVLLHRIAREHQRSLQLASSASHALLAYDWPGNVRELGNALEYAVTVCAGQTIHIADLPPDIRNRQVMQAGSGPVAFPELAAYETAEVQRIRSALNDARYDRVRAAATLGISRTTLWRKMKQYRL